MEPPLGAAKESKARRCLSWTLHSKLGSKLGSKYPRSKLWAAGACCATLLATVALRAAPLPPDTCSNLKITFSMPHATINSAQTVPAGTFNPANRGGANTKPVTGLPTFCRVTATLVPTSDSQIGVEVWMPTSGWNGKLQAIGNHELGGVIFYGDMGAELKRNFAVASTDTGHTGGCR